MKRLLLVLAVAASAGCAHASEQPYVPQLRGPDAVVAHSPTEDAPFRLAPPAPLGEESFAHINVESATLENGLRVFLVERRGFPSLSARLLVNTAAASAGDAGGWRAQLGGIVFLSPAMGVLRTSGYCGPVGCMVASEGPSDELSELLGRIADLAYAGSQPEEAYERRLALAASGLERGGGEGQVQIRRAARTLIFGLGQPYGEPSATPTRPTLGELHALREREFVPRASTLVVAGDFDRDSALAEIRKRFGAWADHPPVQGKAEAPPQPQDGRRVIAIRNATLTQTLGAIVARGPAPRDEDWLTFALLATMLGGTPSSAAWRHVREEMAAAYNVGAGLDVFPEASMIILGGTFERSKALEGMNGLFGAIHRVRDQEIPAETLDEAKRALIAGWRKAMSTNEGITSLVYDAIVRGEPFERMQDYPARVRAITPARVQAVAQRYLAASALRAIFVGQPSEVAKIDAPALGPVSVADGFGRPLPAPSAQKTP